MTARGELNSFGLGFVVGFRQSLDLVGQNVPTVFQRNRQNIVLTLEIVELELGRLELLLEVR